MEENLARLGKRITMPKKLIAYCLDLGKILQKKGNILTSSDKRNSIHYIKLISAQAKSIQNYITFLEQENASLIYEKSRDKKDDKPN